MLNDKTKIGPRISKNFKFLKTLGKTRSKNKRSKLINLASADELLSIVEIAINILKANFNLTKRQRNKLVPFADLVRKISRSRSEKTARKLIQRGGNIAPFIASLLLPILINLIAPSKNS